MRAITYKTNPLGWAACKLLRGIWPGCLAGGLNGFSLVDMPRPSLPGKDWLRVRTRLGGICGSDVAIVAQKQPADSVLQGFATQPFVPGHENVAEVIEAGREVDPSLIGQRVIVEPTLGCLPRGTEPMCPRCQAGEFGACENFSGAMGGRANLPAGTSIGYCGGTGGSWGDEFLAHQSQIIPLEDCITDEQAVVVDPLACSLHAVLRANLQGARLVLVYGAGLLGLAAVDCLRGLGYTGRVDILGRGATALELAAARGADECFELPDDRLRRGREIARRTEASVLPVRFGNYMLSGGYDLVFDCIGSARSVTECLKWTRSRGQVIMLGTLQQGAVDLTPLWFSELTVRGAYGRQKEYVDGRRVSTYRLVLEMIADGRLHADGLVTHKFTLDNYKAALMMALHKSRHGAVKIVFDFRNAPQTQEATDA